MPFRTLLDNAGPTAPQRPWLWPWLGVAAAVLALGVAAVLNDFRNRERQAGEALQAVSSLRLAQLEGWWQERQNLGRFLANSRLFSDALARWQAPGGDAALVTLLTNLADLRLATGADDALLVDAQDQVLLHEAPGGATVPPTLAEALRRARASGQIGHTGLYLHEVGAPHHRLDLVLPLRYTGRPARVLLVLRFDAQRELMAPLATWPGPTATGHAQLWRREGDQLLALSPLRGLPESAGQWRTALAGAALPLAQVLQGRQAAGAVFEAVAADGAAVLAVARPLAGGDWWLVTEQHCSEINGPAWRFAAGTAGLCLLALLALFSGVRLLAQRAHGRLLAQERLQERARLQTLQLLQAITDNSGDFIFAKDLQGRYLFVNRDGEATGPQGAVQARDALGKTARDLFSPAEAELLERHDDAVLNAGHNLHFTLDLDTPQGHRTQRVVKGPLRDADGQVVGLFGVAHDITEHQALLHEVQQHRHHLQSLVDERTQALQAANAQLAEAERFLRLVTDNLPARIAYWDAEMRCQFANRQFCTWHGLSLAQVQGRSAADLFRPDQFAKLGPTLQAVLAGQTLVYEHDTLRPDGSLWHHLMHFQPDRRPDGTVQGAYAMALDITPLKNAEKQLRAVNHELEVARDAAEAASRAKSAFLANMSHEIRTPMNAIIGLAHLMQRDAADQLQQSRLAKISHSAHHLLQVINDILDLSKIEAGRLELEELEFSLDEVLARVFEMVAEPARAKGLELIVDTDHLPDRLRGDPTRLSQALLNLVANAVKFTHRGWVRLSGELLADPNGPVEEPGRLAQPLHVRFAVTDTGEGVPPDRLQALFNAFEQVDSSTSRRHGGTGLGLALTRRLASLMGGESGAESEPGVGSRFWFTARLGRGAQAGADGPGLAGRRVLLVDDLAEARSALSDRLRQFDMRVDAVESGERALWLAQQAIEAGDVYDLLLIDWQMQPLDGVQTLDRLRQLLGEGLPPAVLVTAFDDDTMRAEAQQARFTAVLVKPITASTLHDTLSRLLRHESAGLPPTPPTPGQAELQLRRRAQGHQLLLAEDNPVNQEVALELLRSVGLQVDLARHGAEAVEMALAKPYSAVLMDLQMPEMDGLEATHELRASGFQAPIIAMTANAFGEDRAQCLAAGMNDHVAKPVDPEILYQTLLRWLPQGTAGDSTMAPTHPAASAPAWLLQVPALDPAQALRAVSGRPDMLWRLVHRFLEHYAQGLPGVPPGPCGPALSAHDAHTWHQAAHSLQGACGAIGALQLQAAARQLAAGLLGLMAPPGGAAPTGLDEAERAALAGQAQGLQAELAQLVHTLSQHLPPNPD